MDAIESIKESLSLSEYGLPYERLLERTVGLPGAEDRDRFGELMNELHLRGVVEFRPSERDGAERVFLKR